MLSATEQYIKPVIGRLLRERAGAGAGLSSPGVREKVFRARGSSFKADFAAPLTGGGWLIVEDDDAQRALSNFCKYWLWSTDQEHDLPLHIIHLVGPGPAQRTLCKFVAEKATKDAPHLRYEMIEVEDWPGLDWVAPLEAALGRVG